MSPANATSSPRDDHVDANPDLARKKQRLSEDNDDESAAEEPLLIEADEPEDIGGSLGTAIAIEDDDDENIIVPYSQDFEVKGMEQPLPQVLSLASEVATGKYYFEVDAFRRLADWIVRHCQETREESAAEWQHQYFELDDEFFAGLGQLCHMMLSTYDLFEPTDVTKQGMKLAMQRFFHGLAELSCRIIRLLPEVLNSTLSRRDSALQGTAAAQPVELFQFLGIAVKTLPKYSELAKSFRRSAKVDMDTVTTNNLVRLSQPDVLEALCTMIKMLSGAMRQIKNSWTMLQDALRIITNIFLGRGYSNFPNDVFEEVMEIVKACILPAVCAKHPGALPDNFHHELIDLGIVSLQRCAQDNIHSETCQAYLRFVRSDEDAMLHDYINEDAIPQQLAQASGGNVDVLGQLLGMSWAMQASMAYVRSDIMNIRNIGLTVLTQQLHNVWDLATKARDLDHPYVQHAVRFLRKNEVSKYIFSSDSHASLVSESALVIAFLAVTATYTDQETDVIWRACSTSVEADFVKASFGVLFHQLPSLDFGHVLYILKKYESTPIDGLGAAAVDFLPEVLQRLESFHGTNLEQADRLDLAFSTIDVLKHVDASNTTAFSTKLRGILHIAIKKFASNVFTTDDRREIYARFLPDIGKDPRGGTTAAEVLTILLSHQLPPEDADAILTILPVSAAVDDLQSFVAANKDLPETDFTINSIILRLAYILRLMSLDTNEPDETTVKKIFDSVFGQDALCESARGAAWEKLHTLTAMNNSPAAAIDLWKIYMQRYVPSLPTALASPRLVQLIIMYLLQECSDGKMAKNYGHLLEHPLWEALGRFATTSKDNQVIDSATAAISQFLFDYPAHPSNRDIRDGAIECQRETVRAHVRTLQQDHDELLQSGTDDLDAIKTISLLHSLLVRSREFANYYAPANSRDVVVLDSPNDDVDRLSFTIQIYGAEPQPQVLSVQASTTTTVSQLLASLPSSTGAALNRVIAAGREITGLTTQSLCEAGVQNSGVIQIRPRYKQDFDFDHLLMSIGPVEKEIVAHFDALESLLDVSSPVAEATVEFLRVIPPNSKARDMVTSSSTTATELFPKDRPARAQFSVCVLDWHLRDCARLGIADTQFLTRGAQLLASALVDEERELLERTTPLFLACLHAFLQGMVESGLDVINEKVTSPSEYPVSDRPAPFLEDGASFARRMMDRLIEIERVSRSNAAMTGVASSAYGTLLLATQLDAGVWQYVSTSNRSAELHEKLLLHPNAAFSEGIARPIRSVCQNSDTPKTVSDFFWESLLACLPDALYASTRSFVYFALASDVLHTTGRAQTDEETARNLVEQLCTVLWSYRHTESVNVLLRDDAMEGLLRLLKDAVTILRSFKKPLQLEGLSSKIAGQLLFPDETDPDSRPIINDDTRSLAYDLMRLTLEAAADFEGIVEVTEHIVKRSVRQIGARFPGPAGWRRGPTECAGLTNLGMTCYMNSMLQQLFGNVQFRKFVLDLPVLYPEKQVLLSEIQTLFAKMQGDVETSQNTTALARALGVQVGNQEDVHDFYASLVSRLEEEMPDTECKVTLSKFFTGQSITQIRGECGHVSSQKEAFGDLSVTVKNKPNLHDSLAEFVQGEPMEGSNKYKCMSCDPENGRLVDAMRRTCLEDVPDCLTVCLKRFTYASKFLGEGKVNDRFDFPEVLDMSLYKRSHLENPEQPQDPDIFKLVGVIVHQGSLNLGHYWSYVRVPNPNFPGAGDWFYLEDTKTTYCPAGFETIQQECYGGQRYSNGNERPDNAYVLCYQRMQYIAEASLACEVAVPVQVGLPKVPLNEPLAKVVNEHNGWKQMVAALFDSKFANHVCWLLIQYPNFKEARADSPDSGSSPDTTEHSEGGLLTDHDATVGALMGHYMVRVLLSDPLWETKLSPMTSAFKTALMASPKLSRHILGVFSEDDFWFQAMLLSENSKVRGAILELLMNCIVLLRELDHSIYAQTIKQLLETHSSLLVQDCMNKHPRIWNDYFALPGMIARQGSKETGWVLEREYFPWIIEIIWMHQYKDWTKKHLTLWNFLQRNTDVDFDPLFQFLYELLSEHVDLSDLYHGTGTNDDGTRVETPNGWYLTDQERSAITRHDDRNRVWHLFMLANWRCSTVSKAWKDYGFGKFMGLLIGEKADQAFRPVVASTLAIRFDKEDSDLRALLLTTLHFCANTEDHECRETLRRLFQNLPPWNQEKRVLGFLRDVFPLAPCAVMDNLLPLIQGYLLGAKETNRQATAMWLQDHVFVEQPLSDDHRLDASRARVARNLALSLSEEVRRAYNGENAKNKWEAAMQTLQAIATYTMTLVEAVTQASHQDVELPAEIVVETDEARSLIPRLEGVLQDLEHWESNLALPTRSMNIRQSVEVDETDDAVSDDEEELEEFDDISQSM